MWIIRHYKTLRTNKQIYWSSCVNKITTWYKLKNLYIQRNSENRSSRGCSHGHFQQHNWSTSKSSNATTDCTQTSKFILYNHLRIMVCVCSLGSTTPRIFFASSCQRFSCLQELGPKMTDQLREGDRSA
jgi:hypothetical protein